MLGKLCPQPPELRRDPIVTAAFFRCWKDLKQQIMLTDLQEGTNNCIFNSYFIRELEYDFVEMPRFYFGIISHSDGGCPIILVLVTILEKVDLIVLGPHEHLDCSPDGMKHRFVAEAVAKIVESLSADSRVPKVTMLDSGH